MTLRIVGFNLSHDSSACLVEDGRVRAALALERTTRVKRGVVPAHAYAAAMSDLTHDVLTGTGLTTSDVDYWIATSTESRDADDEQRLARALGLLVPAQRCLTLPHPGHHLAHASAAFYCSGFDEAAAVVIDAYGSRVGPGRERETGFFFQAGAAPERVLQLLRGHDRIAGRLRDGAIWLPETLNGIGEIYRVVTLALGFREAGTTYDDAGKTMGLAPYGRRLSPDNMFIQAGPDGLSFDRAATSLVELGLAVRQDGELRLQPRPPGAPLQSFHQDLAAQVQAEFEDACLYLVREVQARTGSTSLALSGGCFLNSVVNTRIIRETPIERLFVFPAATDDGNAAGAALYAHHVILADAHDGRVHVGAPLTDVYLGPPRLAAQDVPAIAERWGLAARRHASTTETASSAASAIARGEIVGWFQDRAEFGPRALGARSILCHPGLPGMKNRLNARVKFREPFRPFAASILAERAGRWFDMPVPFSPFMLLVCQVWPAQRDAVAEIVHVDGSCRVQTVDSDLPGAFRALLEAFEQETGLPMVLNTSLNLRGMPIMEHPEEAIDCLYGSRLDRLYVGDVEVEAPDRGQLRPVRTGAYAPFAHATFAGHRLHAAPARAAAAAIEVFPSGRRVNGTADASLHLLERSSADTTMHEIAAEMGVELDTAVDLALDLRRHGLLRWAGLPQLFVPPSPLPQYEPQTYGA